MKRKLSICFSFVLVFSMLLGNSMIAKASTADNTADAYKSAMSQVVDYMNTHASKINFTGIKTFVIPLKDGTTAYSTVSLEDITPKSSFSTNSTISYPVQLGHSYSWTWTVKLDSTLGGQSVIKIGYKVSSSSYSSLTGISTSISVSPPQGYALEDKDMYFISDSGDTLTASGYATCKTPVHDVYINQYYDVEIFGTSGYANITYDSYFL